MKIHENIQQNALELYKSGEVKLAMYAIISAYELGSDELVDIAFREKADKSMVVFTTEGEIAEDAEQVIRVPENVLDFPFDFVVHLLAHECFHVKQKAGENIVLDKNEREFQAYYYGLQNELFPNLPPVPASLKPQLGKQALRYYEAMTAELKEKYATEKAAIDEILKN